jgi:hypothetical protein
MIYNITFSITFLLFPLLAAIDMVFEMYPNLPFSGLVPDEWML